MLRIGKIDDLSKLFEDIASDFTDIATNSIDGLYKTLK